MMKDQPPPKTNNMPAVWDLVIRDMQERDKIGEKRYGTRLQPNNGRDAMVDAYQETLDKAVYLRQEIYERDNAPNLSGVLLECKEQNNVSVENLMSILEDWPWLVESPVQARKYCAGNGMSWNEFVAFLVVKESKDG